MTDPNTGALGATIKKAIAAGIPVTMFNAGGPDALGLGALGYFGQGEKDAGNAVGKRVVADGGKNILCVIQEQGQQQLEDRCDGVTAGTGGAAKVSKIYVNGRDDSAVTTSIQAKLGQDKTIDWVVTLGAGYALDAVKSVKGAGSSAKIGTFDTNKQLVAAVQDGSVTWAIDQQPYLQGYEAVDALWLYKTNGNTLGGGEQRRDGSGVHRQVQHRRRSPRSPPTAPGDLRTGDLTDDDDHDPTGRRPRRRPARWSASFFSRPEVGALHRRRCHRAALHRGGTGVPERRATSGRSSTARRRSASWLSPSRCS